MTTGISAPPMGSTARIPITSEMITPKIKIVYRGPIPIVNAIPNKTAAASSSALTMCCPRNVTGLPETIHSASFANARTLPLKVTPPIKIVR